MADFNDFAANLLEEAKRFLEKANTETNSKALQAYIHSSILIGMCALEAYINGIAEELLTYDDLPLVEKALLAEKDIEFKGGEFIVTERLKIARLTDRIEYLYFKFKKEKLNGLNESWWSDLKKGLTTRNSLVHPKTAVSITESDTVQIIRSIIDCLLCLSTIIYNKPFPFKNLGLQSKLTF